MDELTVRPFGDAVQLDAIRTINAYLANWPYARLVDESLITHWKGLPAFQPENFLIAYRSGVACACAHGELAEERRQMNVHLLAVMPGAVTDAVRLLQCLEEKARAKGLERLVGPHWAAAAFYGGYMLGREPYHPHWAIVGTEAYVRAGFFISLFGALMVRDLAREVVVDEAPAGYDIVEAMNCEEYDARAFGFLAHWQGERVAHCYARLYPHLQAARNGTVGQVGDVRTAEAHRGRGLARVMTQMCLARLKAWGATEVLIATRLDNAPALRAYERAGFERRHFIAEWSKQLSVG